MMIGTELHGKYNERSRHMFHLEEFRTHIFHDGIITGCQNRDGYSMAWGEYPEEETERSGYRYFHFLFREAWPLLPEMQDVGILSIEIVENTGRENDGQGKGDDSQDKGDDDQGKGDDSQGKENDGQDKDGQGRDREASPGNIGGRVNSPQGPQQAVQKRDSYSVKICGQNDHFILAEFACKDISLQSGESDFAGWEEGRILLQEGRPQDESGRLEKEIRVYDLLDDLAMEYQRVDHAPVMTMEACQEASRVLGSAICKNLFLCNRQKTQFYLLMMPGDKVFHTRELSAQIGSARLSFGDPEFMEQFLDIAPGSLSVMGLMNDREGRVRLLVDEDVLQEAFLGCHPCVNTSSIRLRTGDVFGKFLEAVGHDMTVVHLA